MTARYNVFVIVNASSIRINPIGLVVCVCVRGGEGAGVTTIVFLTYNDTSPLLSLTTPGTFAVDFEL